MAYMLPHLTPVPGCHIADRRVIARELAADSGLNPRRLALRNRLCVLGAALRDGVPMVHARDADGDELWLAVEHAVCAIAEQQRVGHVSVGSGQGSLGEGRVVQWRRLGGREQLLVELEGSLERRWLPFEHLRPIRAVEDDVIAGESQGAEHAERLRLRVLGEGLRLWHQNTGALDELDIDPLPHQLHLVHHLVRSGHLNWIIADDVGLGKTIEVGMILHQRLSRQPNARVLIVTPPGLVKQWQEELSSRFGLTFDIYGDEVRGRRLEREARIIASMDKIKRGKGRAALEAAGRWDLIIVDEAHRLTRRQYGLKYSASERFKLAAEVLRPRTDHLLLLTATPHQGKTDQFQALLELVRPELREQILGIEQDNSFLRDVMYRNRKVDVTDARGEFIFHGQDAYAVELETGADEQAFDAALQRYFQQALSGTAGRTQEAVGFVISVMRKLAASSHAAILRALCNRRARLLAEAQQWQPLDDDEIEVLEGEELERALEGGGLAAAPFFAGEQAALDALIGQAEALHAGDKKLGGFMERIVGALGSDRKLLVFTEFRGTQAHLVEALSARYGADAVCQIHGQMGLEERRAAQRAFEDKARFLVSTEAGGEGLNLHRRCHTMVNYDLPWNPMRMVQRVGRLYRYGQTKRVQVYNLFGRATVDERVVGLMYQRLETVARELGGLSSEFVAGEDGSRLWAEIFGEMAELMDVEELLKEQRSEARSAERVAEALERARQARALHQDLLAGARGFDPGAMAGQLELGREHVMSFVRGMMEYVGGKVERELYGGRELELRLPEELARRLGRRGLLMRVAAAREGASEGAEVLRMRDGLLPLLLDAAQEEGFGGRSAHVEGPAAGLLVAARLCWMGDRGQAGRAEIEREELALVVVGADGRCERNGASASGWLLKPAVSRTRAWGTREARSVLYRAGWEVLEAQLEAVAHDRLHPAARQIVAAADICIGAQ